MEYLAFEAPIREMDEQLERTRAMAQESDVDLSAAIAALEQSRTDLLKSMSEHLTAWQRVQLSRHPNLVRFWGSCSEGGEEFILGT